MEAPYGFVWRHMSVVEHWDEELVSEGHVIGLYQKCFTRECWMDIEWNLHIVDATAKSDKDKLWRL